MPGRVEVTDLSEAEISSLLSKQSLSSVQDVEMFWSDSNAPHTQFMKGALFARICAEATALQAVDM